MDFLMPPKKKNARGDERTVGVELEFAGIELDDIVEIIQAMFGGEIRQKSTFSYEVRETCYGTFAVDLDAPRLKDKSYLEVLEKLGIALNSQQVMQNLEDFLLKTASAVIPFEVGTPPMPLSELAVLDDMRQVLCARQAQGTRTSLFFAFGLHINPEVPSEDTGRLLNYLRAFLLLYDWICEKDGIDFARRMTPFINPFPDDYVNRVLDWDYAVNRAEFIRDYLQYNPTRYRPLDMLCLFLHLDKHALDGWGVDPTRISQRPTFHYRLPNCLIDEPNWRIAREWNTWVQVERLAEEECKLQKLCEVFVDESSGGLRGVKWSDRVEEWIE